jgi:hypothetical protein
MRCLRIALASVALATTLTACSSSDRDSTAVDSSTETSTRRTAQTDASDASDASDATDATPTADTPVPPSEPPVTDAGTAATTHAGPSSTAAEASDDVTFGPGTVDVVDPTIGLDALATYHAVLTMTFSGTRAGAPASWQVVRDVVVSRDPSVRILTTTQTGPAPSTRRRIEIGRSRYEQSLRARGRRGVCDNDHRPRGGDDDHRCRSGRVAPRRTGCR